MAEKNVRGMRVAIVVTDDFEQVELTEPKKALQEAGATTTIIAPKSGRVQGMNHDEKADTFPVDLTLGQADPREFDAVVLPGGALNADALRVDEKAQEFSGPWIGRESRWQSSAMDRGCWFPQDW